MSQVSPFLVDSWLSSHLGFVCYSWKRDCDVFPRDLWRTLTVDSEDWMLTTIFEEAADSGDAVDINSGFRDLPGRSLLCDVRISFKHDVLGVVQDVEGRQSDRLPPTAIIRPIRPSDADAVCAIAQKVFVHSRFHMDPRIALDVAMKLKGEWARNIALGSRGQCGWVLDVAGTAVGFVGLARRKSVVDERLDLAVDLIAVDSEFTGRGVGDELLTQAISHAVRSGVDLYASTQRSNVAAQHLYRRNGLQQQSAIAWIAHSRPRSLGILKGHQSATVQQPVG